MGLYQNKVINIYTNGHQGRLNCEMRWNLILRWALEGLGKAKTDTILFGDAEAFKTS